MRRKLNRRQFSALLAGLGFGGMGGLATALAQSSGPAVARGARPRLVIIGGGAGGGTLAHLIRRGSPNIDVTLIEVQRTYTTCFFSNLYFGGFRSLDSLVHGYDGLQSLGVTVIHDRATAVDPGRKSVRLASGASVPYDRLVLAPGIDFKYETVPGYSEAAADKMPHAYKAGAQTKRLMDQLVAMRDGGVVVLAAPPNPYRCPPGPYERACMIAHYLKTAKPRSKLIILDPKRSFSKQELFVEAFETLYKGIIELNLSNEIDNHALRQVDPVTMTVETVSGRRIKADVANIIPAQRAGDIARIAGVNEGDWCPIIADSFASMKVPDIYVIGDSAIAGEMPKSAFSANSQAKAVANDLEARLADKPRYPTRLRNTCWSMLGPANSVKIGASYVPRDGKLVATGSFVSKTGEEAILRDKSFKESNGWYAGIVAEAFNRRVAI